MIYTRSGSRSEAFRLPDCRPFKRHKFGTRPHNLLLQAFDIFPLITRERFGAHSGIIWPMKYLSRLVLIAACFCLLLTTGAQAQDDSQKFAAWLLQLRTDALSAGISRQTLDAALDGIKAPQKKIIASDQKQPEKTQSLADYVSDRVSEERVATGRQMLKRYSTWLGRIEKQYGVQRRFIVALWGIESSYGRNTGELPVIQALVTLAYDGRRGDYFRKELFDALRIIDAGSYPLVAAERLLGRGHGTFPVHAFLLSSLCGRCRWRRFVSISGARYPMRWRRRPIILPKPAGKKIRPGDAVSGCRGHSILLWPDWIPSFHCRVGRSWGCGVSTAGRCPNVISRRR